MCAPRDEDDKLLTCLSLPARRALFCLSSSPSLCLVSSAPTPRDGKAGEKKGINESS